VNPPGGIAQAAAQSIVERCCGARVKVIIACLLWVYLPRMECLPLLPSGQVLWPYRDSNTGQHQSIALQPTELIRRFLQHVLPKSFCLVRLFGWLHPAAKIRGNRVRALLQQAPVLTLEERQVWQALEESPGDFEPGSVSEPEATLGSAPRCPCCGRSMILMGSWPPLPSVPSPTLPRAP
jgi:hypothetical protein